MTVCVSQETAHRMYRVTVKTGVAAPMHQVWSQISTMKGVNAELFPLLQMSCPDANISISKDLAKKGPLFRSWLFLFGIIPIEYDDIGFSEVVEGRSFSERSEMALMSCWHHDRKLENLDQGTLVIDELAYIPRVRILGPLLQYIVRFLFLYRHGRLRTRFGCCACGGSSVSWSSMSYS